jgi:hypothetical protein
MTLKYLIREWFWNLEKVFFLFSVENCIQETLFQVFSPDRSVSGLSKVERRPISRLSFCKPIYFFSSKDEALNLTPVDSPWDVAQTHGSFLRIFFPFSRYWIFIKTPRVLYSNGLVFCWFYFLPTGFHKTNTRFGISVKNWIDWGMIRHILIKKVFFLIFTRDTPQGFFQKKFFLSK